MKLVNIHILFVSLLWLAFAPSTASAQVWTLQRCIDTAQVYNKALQISRNDIAIGEEKRRAARAALLPKVAVSADYRYFTDLPRQLLPLSVLNPAAPEGTFRAAQFGVPHNINANVQLTLPLYNPEINGHIRTARAASELNELQYQKTEEQVFFDITNLYYNAQILHHQLAFIDSNLINTDQLLANTQLLRQQLLAEGTDVSRVELQLAQLGTQKEQLRSRYEQVLNALKLAMGVSVERDIQIDPTIQYEPPQAYAAASTLDLQLVQAKNRLLSSELQTLNQSRYLPSLNLIGNYGAMGFGYDGQPNSFLDFYPTGFAGVQLNYPLFNGTVTKRRINQKTLELRSNEIQYELRSEQNIMQINNAERRRAVAGKSVETTTRQMELAQTIYEQTALRQNQGTASLTDILLADNALREAQQAYLSAVIDYLKADLELKRWTGNMSAKN